MIGINLQSDESPLCFVLMTLRANGSIEVIWIFVHMHKQTPLELSTYPQTDTIHSYKIYLWQKINGYLVKANTVFQIVRRAFQYRPTPLSLWLCYQPNKVSGFLFLSMKGESIKEISSDCMSRNVLDGYTIEVVGMDWMMTQQRLLSFGNVSRKRVLTNNWLLRSLILWSPKWFR